MAHKRPEPVQVVKQRRDAALNALVDSIPYIKFLGIEFDRRGDELTAIMPFKDELIGNPFLPALHGGAIGALMEITASAGLLAAAELASLPKPIDVAIDYLR
ncbi:MAG: PaaI family thioesterase, partial [Pseudomonadota bacterium]|nr:PaaI family thioesterase [Pseudomonadota bacterium]